jgi:hypothetical protein
MDGYFILIVIFYIFVCYILMWYFRVQDNPSLYPPKHKVHKNKKKKEKEE